jgi:hypothetical protein
MAKKETVVETPAEAVAAPVSLTVQDLIVAKNIIDIVAQRGAIRADEMPVVGAFYTKLVAFLKEAGAFPAPAETPAPDAETTTEE